MFHRRLFGSIFTLALLASTARAQDAPSYAELRALVLPTADELAWKDRDWRAGLWAGVVEAQAADKPILLWAMNGHPLGCT